MVADGGAGAASRVRLALALLLGGAIAQLLLAWVPPAGDLSPVLLLAAVAVLLAAVLVLGRSVGFSARGPVAVPPGTADEAPAFLAARVTDPLHFPLRPRAPGQV